MVLLGIVIAVVDPQDDGDVGVGGRRRDQDLFRPSLQVLFRFRALGEQSRGFDDQVDPQLFPGQFGGILDCHHLDLFLSNLDEAVSVSHIFRKNSENRVILQQMGQGLGIRDIIDRQDLDPRRKVRRAIKKSADPSKTVYSHFHAHA